MADDDTWLDSFPVTRTDYPLPFDMNLQAKPAYWGIVDPTQLPGYGMTFAASNNSGALNTRVWTLTATNGSVGTAYATQINGLTLTQTAGAACTPVITPPSAYPVVLGDIPANGSASAYFTINFTGCPAQALFKLSAPWSSATYDTGTLNTPPLSAGEPQAVLVSPAQGATLAGSGQSFSWTANGATAYELYLGTSLGAGNLFSSGQITSTSVVSGNLPANGETIYARLWANFNGVWTHNDSTFTAASEAALTSPRARPSLPPARPLPGCRLPGPPATPSSWEARALAQATCWTRTQPTPPSPAANCPRGRSTCGSLPTSTAPGRTSITPSRLNNPSE